MAISVLIVEDDRNIAELLQMYLEKEGYAVTVAGDGGQFSGHTQQFQGDRLQSAVSLLAKNPNILWSVFKCPVMRYVSSSA